MMLFNLQDLLWYILLFFKNLLPTGSGSMHGMHNHIQALFKEFLAATVF